MEATEEISFTSIFIEQTKLLASATETITQAYDNITGLFQDLALLESKIEKEESAKMDEFQHYRKKILDYINHVHIEIPALMDVIKESEEKFQKQLEEHGQEIKERNEKIQKLETQVKECEHQYDDTVNDMEKQNTYTAAMGSTLAKMLWKTSKSEDAIKTYIDTDTLNPFLNITNNTIEGFQATYQSDFPASETFETNFLLSLIGIYTNIVAQEVGRNYVLDNEVGVSSVNKILLYLREMPMPTAQLLKRLVLMFLYNLSITLRGAELIANNEQGLDNILMCLDATHTEEIQSITLSLLISLAKELDSEFCKKVKSKISHVENFKILMNSDDSCLAALCSQLMEKLNEN